MNIIPKNYIQKYSLREIQEVQSFIRNKLIELLSEKFELLEVRQPLVSANRPSLSNSYKKTRPINFDSSNDDNIYFLYNEYRYWLVNTINAFNIKNNNGIITNIKNVYRDSEITNTTSLESNNISIEYRFDNKKIIFEKGKELADDIISILKQLENELIKNFRTIKPAFPKNIIVKNFNRLSTQRNYEDLMSEISSENKAFLLHNSRTSGEENPINSNFEIALYAHSKANGTAFPIFVVMDRKTLNDLEPIISESESIMEEYLFSKQVLTSEDTRTININIDLDALVLFILNMCHILELQSGLNIEEIEKILSSAGIKHI